MTAVPNDFVRLEGTHGTIDLNCIENGIPWPPPPVLHELHGEPFAIPLELISHSEVSDDEAFADPGLARGAIYWPVEPSTEGGE